jgi:UDP-N-acetylmuramate dehydrogenase
VFESFNPQLKGDLKKLSSIRVGGQADFIIRVQSKKEFISLFNLCRETETRLIPMGMGTNVFFTDNQIRGVVAVISFADIKMNDETTITVSAGASLSDLLEFSFQMSLSGLELFTGIPGTVGGAVFGNAGAYGADIGSRLRRALILSANGDIVAVDNSYFEFAYRDSVLKRNRAVLLEADFELSRGNQANIRQRSGEIMAVRNKKLPSPRIFTVGSYFKNLCLDSGERKAAALYLDAVGSKECAVGDAFVFNGHANIICNRMNCRARDILQLEKILVGKVEERFGFTLEREVIYIH